MHELDGVLTALAGPRVALRDVLPTLSNVAGLYAIHGDEQAWTELRIETPGDGRPLYVGKAEDSFQQRDIKTHFSDGHTGRSTVRRSFAALLRTQLALSGIPRKPSEPGHFDKYGLSPADDAKLTHWMRDRLEIAVWPTDGRRALELIEEDVIVLWAPPINIDKIKPRDRRADLSAQRKVMADEARAWRPGPK